MIENLEDVHTLPQAEDETDDEVCKDKDQWESFLAKLLCNARILRNEETHYEIEGCENGVDTDHDKHNEEDYRPDIASREHAEHGGVGHES